MRVSRSPEEIAKAKAFQKKLQDKQDQQNAAQQRSMPSTAGGGSANAKPLTTDQEQYRECMESGRDPARCSGQSTTKGITSMLGLLIPQAGDVQQDIHHPGLFLTGAYKGAGTFRIDFGETAASIVCKEFRAGWIPVQRGGEWRPSGGARAGPAARDLA